MASLEIRGGEQFAVLAAKLKAAGDKGMERELYSALNRSTKPLRADAKESALINLPRTGGLNQRVAGSRFSVRRRSATGVRIVANGLTQLSLINDGTVRHSVYGRRGTWVTQSIPQAKDWFYKPMRAGADEVRRELVKAMDAIARKIA